MGHDRDSPRPARPLGSSSVGAASPSPSMPACRMALRRRTRSIASFKLLSATTAAASYHLPHRRQQQSTPPPTIGRATAPAAAPPAVGGARQRRQHRAAAAADAATQEQWRKCKGGSKQCDKSDRRTKTAAVTRQGHARARTRGATERPVWLARRRRQRERAHLSLTLEGPSSASLDSCGVSIMTCSWDTMV
jgi:hypothetical protein